MKTTLNIDGFIDYADNTGKYTTAQLQAIYNALCVLEDANARLSWKVYGINSHEYIYENLTQCCDRLETLMTAEGLKGSEAATAVTDFKKWMKAYMD